MKKECGTCIFFNRKNHKCRLNDNKRKATDPVCVFYIQDYEFMKAIQTVFDKN